MSKVLRLALIAFFSLSFISLVYVKKPFLKRDVNLLTNSVNEKEKNNQNSNLLTCTRTSRLDNDPKIDRALSFIQEKLTSIGTDTGLFSPTLVNCIKVEVKNIKNETGAEGYFDPENKGMKSDYFPIVLDDWGNFFNDDLTTALILVHEITHVQQFINVHNNTNAITFLPKSKGTCLNDEVSAFLAQLRFTTDFNDEEKKSINYRMKYDKNLHPQLQTLSVLKNSLNSSDPYNCEPYDIECINRNVFTQLSYVLKKSGVYEKQCDAYGGI